MDINQIGLLVNYQRNKKNVTTEALCEGICDRSLLSRLEIGERECEKIVAEALLQRLGFASDELLYFLNDEEIRWLEVRELLLEAVANDKTEDAKRYYDEYETMTRKKNRLHKQFLLLLDCIQMWKQYQKSDNDDDLLNIWEEKILDAWMITREQYGISEENPKYMTFYELLLKILYYHAQEEMGYTHKALRGYEQLLAYVEDHLEQVEQVKFYPLIVYRMLLLMEKLKEAEDEQAALYQKCMVLMKKEGSMVMLQELSEYRKRFLMRSAGTPLVLAELEEVNEVLEVLDWLYTTYQIRKKDWYINLLFSREEVFPLADTIKNRRMSFGWTQEELADGLCEALTISRIETGITSCRKGNLGELMDRLHLPGGAAVLSVQMGRADTYDLVTRIRRLSKFGRYEEIQPLFAELKKKTVHNRYADQFMIHRQATIQRNTKQIDFTTHWERQKEALRKTLPDRSISELRDWVFTRTEAMIVNSFAYCCREVGKTKETIEWLELVKTYYERQKFHAFHYFRGYAMTLWNLGSLFDQTMEYEKAIEYEDIAIRLAIELGEGNLLRPITYDRGWNMEQLWESGEYTKEESRPYIRAALCLNRLYAKADSISFVEKKWKEMYLTE